MGSATEPSTAVVKVLGKEYAIRTDADPQHIQEVSEYVDRTLQDIRRGVPDTQEAAILAALNFASELIRVREAPGPSRDKLQAMIDLIDSV